MALTDLGTNTIWQEDKWVSFDRIRLESGFTYSLIAELTSSNPDTIYSYFLFRFMSRDEGNRIASMQIGKTYYDNERVFMEAFISPNLGNNKNITFEARRFSYYDFSGQLSQVDLNLKLDPEQKY